MDKKPGRERLFNTVIIEFFGIFIIIGTESNGTFAPKWRWSLSAVCCLLSAGAATGDDDT